MPSDQDEIARLRLRVEKLEAQVHLLLGKAGLEAGAVPGARPSARVLELASRGETVAAIRAYREETGASLKNAKQAVESLAAAWGRPLAP